MGIFIPPDLSKNLKDDRLEIGSVFFAMVQDTQPPKEKYFVVVEMLPDSLVLGNVYINSQINPNLFASAALQALHLPATVADCPFLKWNSFIDCSDIYTKNIVDLELLLASSVSPFVGCTYFLKSTILQRLCTVRLLLQERYGVAALALFGSFCQGEQTESSDIDIMVTLSKWDFRLSRMPHTY